VTYHLEKTAAAVMVLGVVLKMCIERVDAVCENCDLNFRRTCIGVVKLVIGNYLLLFVFE
jgi:hypothetical protein